MTDQVPAKSYAAPTGTIADLLDGTLENNLLRRVQSCYVVRPAIDEAPR